MSPMRSPGKPHLLVVEDNPADVQLLRLALDHAGLDCDVTVLEDGAAALAYIRKLQAASHSAIPNLVVLDLNLPKNGGIEILEAIRNTAAFNRMAVAILSSSSSPRERQRIDSFGVDRFITKPLDLDAFMEIGNEIKSLLLERRAVNL